MMPSAVDFRKPPAQSVRFGLNLVFWKKAPPLTPEQSLRQALTQLKEAGDRLSLSSTGTGETDMNLVELRCEDVARAARRWVEENMTWGDWYKPVQEALQAARLQKGLYVSKAARRKDLWMLDNLPKPDVTRWGEERQRLLGPVRDSLAATLARNIIAQKSLEAGDIPEAFQERVREDIKDNEAVAKQLRQALEGYQERL